MIDNANESGMRDVSFFDQTYKLFTKKGVPKCAINYNNGINA